MKNDSPLSDIKIGEVTAKWAQSQKIKTNYSRKTESTSTQAKKEAFSDEALNEHLLLYIAEEQSLGRGRGQNSWNQSRAGAQLLSTWSFMTDQASLPILSPLIGLSIYRAALATWPFLEWNLKAPNDLYIVDKKVAGILIESVSQGDEHRLLVGFGINVLESPDEVKHATSIIEELDEETPLLAEDWIAFLERILFEISYALQLSFEPLNSSSRASLLLALNKHPLLKETFVKIDDQGNLFTQTQKISWTEL